MDKILKESLLKKLNNINLEELLDLDIVLLPDFFVDHFLYFNEFEKSVEGIKNIYVQGGGNIPGISQKIHQGGNAANTALALARLGVKSHLICRTDKLGLHLLKFFLEKEGVDISRVKSDGNLAITTALEFGKDHVNAMIGDTGSVSDFSYDILDDDDLNLISDSDIVCVLNWNLNRYGTDFAYNVFSYAKKYDVKTFFDSGDPSPKIDEIPTLFNNVLKDKNLDIFSLNENELQHYSGIKINSDADAIDAAYSLKKDIFARLDIHTSDFSLSVDKNHTIVPALDLPKIYRGTGAGDAWNAGNIFSELLAFNASERLLFSNIFAAYYISSKRPEHGTLIDIISYVLNTQ